MTLLAALATVTPGHFPADQPSWKLGREGQLIADNFATLGVLTDGMVGDASIVVAAEDTNVRQIAIQLKKANGDDIATRQTILAALLLDANGDAFVVTGGSTGIELGTGGDGAILPIVAKKLFLLISEADGDIDLKWTDTGTEAAYLALLLPNGKMVISAALTNT